MNENIQLLDDHRKMCEAEGKYVEAEMAKQRIKEIKAEDIQRMRTELETTHEQ